jgi:O-antigen/teichoic acid export membrane protein
MPERVTTAESSAVQISRAPVHIDSQSAPEKPRASGARALSLTSNFVWTFAGNGIYALCQWAAIVCLAKLGSVEMVGVFALALAITNPITFLANLQLRVLYVTDQKSKYPFGEILGLRLMLGAVAFVIMVAVCRAAGYSQNTTAVIMLVGVAFLIDSISENYYAIAQRRERMDRIALSQIFRGFLAVAALALIVRFTGNLAWAALGLVIGRILVFLTFDSARKTFNLAGSESPLETSGKSESTSFWKRVVPLWNLRNQMRMLWVAIPLGIASILISVNINMPRYFIEHFRGPHELGIFSALTYIPTAMMMVATALGYAVFTPLSKMYSQGQVRKFKVLVAKIVAFCAAVGAVGLVICAFAGHRILLILYRPEYAEHLQLLLWLVVWGSIGAVAAILGYAMTATSHFREQVPLFSAVTLSSMVACYFLVPRFGGLGGAFAALLAIVVQLIGTGFVIFRALQLRSREIKADPVLWRRRLDVEVSKVGLEISS